MTDQSRIYTTPDRPLEDGTFLRVHFGLRQINNQDPYCTVTADNMRRKGSKRDADFVAAGQLHDEVRQVFPELAELIPWHLCTGGLPIHYMDNARYLHKGRFWDRFQSHCVPMHSADRHLLQCAYGCDWTAAAEMLLWRVPGLQDAYRRDVELEIDQLARLLGATEED